MNISDFEAYEGYWDIIDDDLFEDIFYMECIEKLEPTEKVLKAIELLSYFFPKLYPTKLTQAYRYCNK
jgi:hypothetical protein